MIVCVCRGVSDRTVRAVIASGARTRDEVKKACGAGTSCGKCQAMLSEFLDDVRGQAYGATTVSPYVAAGVFT
jgi:bacterioferritin-associated ferredoxin